MFKFIWFTGFTAEKLTKDSWGDLHKDSSSAFNK